MLYPVILSGGSGTRLWPLSRKLSPKQFLPLTSERTMFQNTVGRLEGLAEIGSPIVLCNEDHRFLAAEQLRQLDLGPASIILEPVARNTAPAVAIGALAALREDPEAVLLVLPADHVIKSAAAFAGAVELGLRAARQGRLVTFGIVPTAPETGYGYIRKGKEHEGVDGTFDVRAFVEKPDLVTAEGYVQSGEYLWNSGMFLFGAARYLEELERFEPEMLSACREAFDKAAEDLDFLRLDADSFARSPEDSIDYAVMEKTEAAAVIPLHAGWSDVGSWSGLWEISERDPDGNSFSGDVLAEEVSGCYIRAGSRMVAAVGLADHVIVETTDAVLVAPRDRAQEVKAIVGRLKKSGRSEVDVHRKVYRPWGSYENIDIDRRFQVKRIAVKPGATLSLQKHHHRAEHWIIVQGTAVITRGEDEITLTEDQSTYIPLGTVHRLHNPGRIPLELIEVQTGSYLGEDDIVRLEDIYGRKS